MRPHRGVLQGVKPLSKEEARPTTPYIPAAAAATVARLLNWLRMSAVGVGTVINAIN